MPVTTIFTTKDASAYEPNDGWSGWDDHHPVGLGSGKYRSFVYFPISFTGMTAINTATLYLRAHRASSGNHVFGNDGPPNRDLLVRRMLYDWGEGTNRGETLWSSQEPWGWSNRAGGSTGVAQGARTFTRYDAGVWYPIDVTGVVRAWFTGSANYGFLLMNANETQTSAGLEFYSRDAPVGYRPYIEIDYSTNTAPNAPTGMSPTADALVNTLSPTLTGTRSDPDAGDWISAYQVQVFEDNGTTLKWDSGIITTSGSPTSFSTVYGGPSLTGGNFYKWQAKTRDKGSAWGTYSAFSRFKVNTPPNPPSLTVSGNNLDQLTLNPTIYITHSDNDPGDYQAYGYRLNVFLHDGTPVYDSGDIDISGSPAATITHVYSGAALSWKTYYYYTARTKDQNGVWGNYATWKTFITHTIANPVNASPSGGEQISGLIPIFYAERGSVDDTLTDYYIGLYEADQQTSVYLSGWISAGISGGSTITHDPTASLSGVLTYGTTYYWWIVVSGPIGGASTAYWISFNTPTDASVPTQNTPTPNNLPTNAHVTSVTPTYTGSRSSALTHVQVQVYPSSSTSGSLGTPVWDSGDLTQSSSTSYSVAHAGTPLDWGATYKWRVRVGSPTLGPWSGLSAFTLDIFSPPTLTAPADAAWITTRFPTLSGSVPSGNAVAYRILVYEADGATLKWDSGDVSQTAATTFSRVYDGPNLFSGTVYQWTARYTHQDGPASSYATRRTFRVNGGPLTPSQLEPTPGFVNGTLFPTFKAYFNDPDKIVGDYPTEWHIEIRNNATDVLIQEKVLTTGLSSGLNIYHWGAGTGGADTGLAYGVDYKWRTMFVDSKSAVGSTSGFQVFKNSLPGTVELITPSEGSNINTTRPNLTWTFTDATQAKYAIWVVRNLTGALVYESGYVVSASTSAQIPTGYLSRNGEYYTIYVLIKDTNGLESNTDSNIIQLELDAPPRIEGLSATVLEDSSAISLDWDASALGSNFVTYVVYRRRTIDEEWAMIGTTKPESNTSFLDYYAGQTVNYDYRVTVVKLIANEPDLESPDSDIVNARLESDVWMVIGRDRSESHIFELFVVGEGHTRPVQQEVFEPLGTNRKTVARGFVLGWEGSMDVTWQPEEKAAAEAQVDYILFDSGPHILKNPFGDVYDVTFGTPDGAYRNVGLQDMTLTWIEVGVNTHNPTLTPDQFLAQIGAT